MSKETDKFLRAEQSVQELLKTLEQLKNEVISYKTSVHQLDAVRQKLSEIIDSFSPVIKVMREVASVLKSTHPELLDKLGSVSVQVREQTKSIQSELDQKVSGVSEQIKSMRLLVITSLFLAGLSVIGILTLLLR